MEGYCFVAEEGVRLGMSFFFFFRNTLPRPSEESRAFGALLAHVGAGVLVTWRRSVLIVVFSAIISTRATNCSKLTVL